MFRNHNFASMLNQYNYNINPGDIVAGTIFNMEQAGFLVDIGEDVAGYLPIEETCLLSKNQKQTKHNLSLTNATREFFIIAYHKGSQQIILSIRRIEYFRAWKRIKQLEDEDITLELKAESTNKGGIITLIEGLHGFIPKSHTMQNISHALIIQKSLKCKFLIADEKNNKLILSYKKAILAHKCKIGETIRGKIIMIKPYGLLIQIYDIIGLLHVSEIDKKNSTDMDQQFNIGETLEVKILYIDMEQGRLYLSTKNLKTIINN